MSRLPRVLLPAVLLMTTACASSHVTEMQDTGAMLRIAAMQQHGELDLTRMDCATRSLVADVDHWAAHLPTRASLKQGAVGPLAAHAAAVQETMAAQEQSQAMMTRSLRNNKAAMSAARDGNSSLAERIDGTSGGQMSVALDILATVDTRSDGEPLTQEAVAPLVRYVHLRAQLVDERSPDGALLEEISTLETEHADVLPTYARFLLRRYENKALTCR